MRQVSTLVLTAVLMTTAALASSANLFAGKPDAQKTAMHAAMLVMEHLTKIHGAAAYRNTYAEHAMTAAKALTSTRSFDAQGTSGSAPAATCDQEGYSAAQVVVLQACPSLSGLISGTVSITDFLPGFCGSNCYKVIAANLPKYSVCLDASTKPLVAFVSGCLSHPECYTETALKTGLSLTATCGSGSTALFNFYNATTAAKTDITNFCTNCLAQEQAYITAYPRCVVADATAAAKLNTALTAMCTKDTAGDYCAWNLRSIGNVDCTNNCQASPWCGSGCNLQMTQTTLDYTCTSGCLSTLVTIAPAIGVDTVLITSLNAFFCYKAPNTTSYCYLVGGGAVATANTSSQAAMAATCAGSASVCVASYLGNAATLAGASARTGFVTCAATVSTLSSLYANCQSSYEAGLRNAAYLQATSSFFCSSNAAGSYCAPFSVALAYDPSYCFYTAAAYGTCSASCQTSIAALQTGAGCCLGPINTILQLSSSSYGAMYLPTGTFSVTLADTNSYSYTFSPLYAQVSLTRSQQPMNALAVCSNTSTLWANVEQACPASSVAVSRSFGVLLSYAAVTANAAVKARIIAGLTADAAIAAQVPPSSIKNATISASATATVATSRRAGTTAAVTFSFAIDGASAAAVASSSAAFDSAASSGVTTTNTGNAAATGCSGCLPPGQDASSLTKSSTSTSSGGTSSAFMASSIFAAAAAFGALLF